MAAGEDDSVVCVVLTGAGDYYCSGNDLSSLAQIPPEGHKKMAAEAKDILRYMFFKCVYVGMCLCMHVHVHCTCIYGIIHGVSVNSHITCTCTCMHVYTCTFTCTCTYCT